MRPRRVVAAVTLLALALAALSGAGASAPTARTRSAAKRSTARPAAPRPRPVPASAAYDSAGRDSFAEPRIFLSWCAPYGSPGARSNVNFTCRDTNEVDTLFLSFETGRDAPRFYGMYARLFFHPPYGDTLRTFWHFGLGWWNQGNLKIEFDNDGTFPCAQPWSRPGMGAPSFEFQPEVGKLEMIYGLPLGAVGPVSGLTRYCYARILIVQKKCALPGTNQPICIEWDLARWSFGHGDVFVSRGGERFVTVNSPDGAVATPYRRAMRASPWVPPPNRPPVMAPEPVVPRPDSGAGGP